MSLLHDYSGAFDSALTLANFSRQFLVHLAREYLLIGHLLGRVAQPMVAGMPSNYLQSAIEEWMAASPNYSKRMQRAMNFEGDDVATVFKNLQLDVGAPQQYMDFQFRLDSPTHGEFWVCHCGALVDAERHGGEKRVRTMCHDVEDPTFDATAAAVNPRMAMRPVHRPPRINAADGNGEGRYPVCRWKVFISDEVQPFGQHPNLEVVRRSKIANIGIVVPEQLCELGGWEDYSGPFDPGCQLEDFSHRALVILCQEFAVQTHLLVRAYLLSQSNHCGEAVAQQIGCRMWIGHAALAVERLKASLNIAGDDVATIAKLFQLHPEFQPRSYVDLRVELHDERCARVSIGDCPALQEVDGYGWFAQIAREPHPALEALACQVNPRARCYPVDDPEDARFAWDIVIDPQAEPRAEPEELLIARRSSGMSFCFEQRRPLRL